MAKPKLTYFDLAASRGEECRLALWIAGVDFEDHRIKNAEWPALKPQTPFGSLPTLELEGRPVLAQSNAILTYLGRTYGLHPTEPFEAARHEAVMCHVEDLRANVTPTLRIADPEEKKAAREKLAATYLPAWAGFAERQLGEGPFFGGSKLHVVDLKLYLGVRWFRSGNVDFIPGSVFDAFPKLLGVYEAVSAHERVKAWYAR